MPVFSRWAWSTGRAIHYCRYVHSGAGVVLRPYQESCIGACLAALESGSTRIGVSLPTGSGKTTVFISLLSRIHPPPQRSGACNSLIIVNSIELARQVAVQIQKLCRGALVEIEQGAQHYATGKAFFTVATYQTLLQPGRLEKFHPDSLKAVIVDEAHHAAAPSYLRILSHFHPAIRNPDATASQSKDASGIPVIGFSATFSRHDGLALGSVFERIVYHRDFLEMIKEQWLCNVRFTSVRAKIDLSKVTMNSRTGDFSPTSLAHVVNTNSINRLVVQTWLDRAATRKSTLVFCVNLAHVRELTKAFREAGVDARYIYSGTPVAERRSLVDTFKAGEFPVLVNCAVLTEGTDIPNIDCVIVARPTRSRNLFAQMIGRGMRLSPATGKEDCRIIDFVDSTKSVPGIISTPTLFGLDPSELIDDESLESLEQRAAEMDSDDCSRARSDSEDNTPDPVSVTYVDYDDPFELIDGAYGAPNIRSLSRNAWVGCGGDVYILECLGKGFIRIEPVKENEQSKARFQVHYAPASLPMLTAIKLKVSPFNRSREILKAPTLVEAIRGADTFATSKAVQGRMAMGLLRSAKWRSQPATDYQKKFIENRWRTRNTTLAEQNPLDHKQTTEQKLATMTKGEAANIIARLKHGAEFRYQKKAKEQQRRLQSLAKEAKRKAREEVKIGPLLVADES